MSHRNPFALLAHPYRELAPLTAGADQLKTDGREPGTALVWHLSTSWTEEQAVFARKRPGGLPLIVVLPEIDTCEGGEVLRHIHPTRPHSVLPHQVDPAASDLAEVLRKPPEDLAADVTDYLFWRGLATDRDTARLIRRIVELSTDLKSISGLSRSLYLSRRALGRRLMTRGLPVPSHWLQLARLLRVAIRLQTSDASVFAVACEFGYPDGFAVSNQMQRLIGYRPRDAREYLGWEWLMEAWLRREAEAGGLAPTLSTTLTGGNRPTEAPYGAGTRARRPARRRRAPVPGTSE